MNRHPAAYIRRSAADSGSPGDISRAVQEQAIAELAKREGHNGDVRIFTDCARSADEEKTAQRSEYAAMLAAVERDEVTTIYAYSLDRLLRSVVMTGKLLKATRDKGVRIVTHREGDLSDDGNPSKWLYTMLVSAFSEYELRMVKQRAAGALARRRQRGDFLGNAPFGHQLAREDDGRIVIVPDPSDPLAPVLEAARAAETVLGACRLLQQRGVLAPNGGKRWSTSALTRILQREAPELLRPRGATGIRGTGIRTPLAGLLRCHCGTTLTPNIPHRQFYCNRGHILGAAAHGRVSVTEKSLMPWVQAEAARLRIPERVQLVETNTARRAELEAQREQLGLDVVHRLLSAEKVQELAVDIEAELERISEQESIVDVPQAIDWSWSPKEINTVLRALWEHVQLDAAMRPIEVAWRVPTEYIT